MPSRFLSRQASERCPVGASARCGNRFHQSSKPLSFKWGQDLLPAPFREEFVSPKHASIPLFALLFACAQPSGAVEHRELAASPLVDGAPGWSAQDGQSVSFSSDRSGDWEIYVVPAGGGEAVNFSRNPAVDIYANWHPGGELITYTSTRDNGSGTGDDDIWIQSLSGDSLSCLTDWEGFDSYAAVNPAGTHMAFTSDRGPLRRRSIWVLEFASGAVTQLSFEWDYCYHSNWSPDGQWIAFDARHPDDFNEQHLFRVALGGGQPEEIPHGLLWGADPGHSPDGRYLAFGGGEDLLLTDLYLWDLQAGQLLQLTDTRHAEQSPYWSPDGGQIVYARVANGNKDVWVASDLGLGTPVRRASWSGLKRAFGR